MVLALLLNFLTTVTSRFVVPLNLGWRTISADHPCTTCTYNALAGSMKLGNSGWVKANISSSAECAAAASSANVQAFSWTTSAPPVDSHHTGTGPWCIIGSAGRVQTCPNCQQIEEQPSSAPASTPVWTLKTRDVRHGPPANAAEAARSYADDDTWKTVDLPHDASIELPYIGDSDGPEGFHRNHRQWYRKYFELPTEFQGKAIFLAVDGALARSTWWVNGVQVVAMKTDGYLPSLIRLDNNSELDLHFLDANTSANSSSAAVTSGNVITVWTSNAATSGWWYEGSGLIRKARLVVLPRDVRFRPQSAIASPTTSIGAITKRGAPAEGLVAATATLHPTADIAVESSSSSSSSTSSSDRTADQQLLFLDFVLLDDKGVLCGTSSSSHEVKGSDVTTTLIGAPLVVVNAELWSVARPRLYTLVTTLRIDGAPVFHDRVNTTIGIRSLEWNAANGLHVNGEQVKMRGFCNHENFAVVGASLPPRVDLLRVQQMRGIGGNAWRTSHNPPEPVLLDITDRLGVLVLDENRVLSTVTNCVGCRDVPIYEGDIGAEAGALALRDRTHASVAWYSLCNENGCTDGTLLKGDVAKQCQTAIHAVDKGRAITGNQAWQGPNAVAPKTPIAEMYDVMGMSHQGTAQLNTFHAAMPDKLVVMTECCSTNTQRGEDGDLLNQTNRSYIFESNEGAADMKRQLMRSDPVSWVGGSFIWTMHDYYGEPADGNKWPHISSSFGAFDLAGFPKAAAWWRRAWWLGAIEATDAGRPPLDAKTTAAVCYLVESWQAGLSNVKGHRILNVYTNLESVRLEINGVATPHDPVTVGPYDAAQFKDVAYEDGNVTAICSSTSNGDGGAEHTKFSWGAPAKIVLTIDAPSIRTGTGSAVYYDGEDVALLRATVVDANGVVVHNANTINITFAVTEGPARIVGCSNGDPADHEPNHVAAHLTYHGLVRVIVKVVEKATGDDAGRALEATVNPDAGRGAFSSSIGHASAKSFTVTAYGTGLQHGEVEVALSTDEKDSVLSVAAASVGLADVGIGDNAIR